MEENISLVRADTAALERQHTERYQHFDDQVQQLHTRVDKVETSQQHLQRDMVHLTATGRELRRHVQRLQGSLQAIQRQSQAPEESILKAKLADLTTRLERLEQHLRASP